MSLARNDPRHGTANAYSNLGCRCKRCRKANTAYSRERRIAGYAEDACPSCGGPMRLISKQCQACDNAAREAPHGTEVRYKRCKCDKCRQAASAAKRRRREATRVPCSHGCGTLVDGINRRQPEKPPECHSCAMKRVHAERFAAA